MERVTHKHTNTPIESEGERENERAKGTQKATEGENKTES